VTLVSRLKSYSVPMSGPSSNAQFVVMDARRQRSPEEKQAIIAELLAPGASVSAIARKHNVAASLLFRWRKQFSEKSKPHSSGRDFVPVMLPAPQAAAAAPCAPAPLGKIEIALTNGRCIWIDQGVDLTLLKRVIDVLEGQ
jgi:transposase